MIYRNSFVIFLLIVTNSLVAVAQSKHYIADIDLSNIYNTQYTYIGIPIRDSVYIYAPPSSKSPTNWSLSVSLSIPKGTLAIDGNIRKTAFMTEKCILFVEQGRYDTLQFSEALPRRDPRLWIRTLHSTEAEYSFLLGEKNVGYYRSYDETQDRIVWKVSDQLNPNMFVENRTQPLLTNNSSFRRLYSFKLGGIGTYIAALLDHEISFYRYPTWHDNQFADEIVQGEELNFTLPKGCIGAFIYDYKYIAVVSQEQISFYGFDKGQKKWIKAIRPLSLRFGDLNQEK